LSHRAKESSQSNSSASSGSTYYVNSKLDGDSSADLREERLQVLTKPN
jgi:hypothetical protein